jgi:hypothetical protein
MLTCVIDKALSNKSTISIFDGERVVLMSENRHVGVTDDRTLTSTYQDPVVSYDTMFTKYH